MSDPISAPARPTPLWQDIVKALLFFSLLLVLAWVLFEARRILLPFLLAGVLAYVLHPLVSYLEMLGFRRSFAVLLIFIILTALLAALFYAVAVLVWQELPRLDVQLPQYVSAARASAIRWESQWSWARDFHVFDRVTGFYISFLRSIVGRLPAILSSLLALGLYAVLVPLVSFSILSAGRSLVQQGMDLCPGRWMEKFLSLIYRFDAVLGGYLRAVLADGAVVGVSAFLGLFVLGVDYALLLGALACVANIIPYAGAIAVGSVAVAMAFFQTGGAALPVKVAVFFLALRFMDDWVFQPFILKRSVDLHPVAVIFALLCGGEVGGFWGLVLAVPAFCIVMEVVKIFSAWYLSETGMGVTSRELWEAASKPWIV